MPLRASVYSSVRDDRDALMKGVELWRKLGPEKSPAVAFQLASALQGVIDLTRATNDLAGVLDRDRELMRETLEDFDFSAQPSLDRRLVDELATLRCIKEKANVLAIGPPGTGKTMLAIALGLKAVQAGYRVYYTTAADLVAPRRARRWRAAGRQRCASGTGRNC
jgi:type IV secretory pathway ATPase VirB11/archaellum biosynthesis ATPase